MRTHVLAAAATVLLIHAASAAAGEPLLLASLAFGEAQPGIADPAEPPSPAPEELPDGEEVFRTRCAPCHGTDGTGVAGQIPPLRGSDYLRADLRRAIRGVLRGLQGEIRVNGETYDGAMPAHSHLADGEIASALTHVLGWSGVAEPVSAELVAEVRRESAGDTEVTVATCAGRAAGGMSGCAMRGGPGACCGACAAAPRRHRHGRRW